MINEPTFLENTLKAVIRREEYERCGLTTTTGYRYMYWDIDGYAVLNYEAELLRYYFGRDWQHEISESMMVDMIHEDLCEMETLEKIPMRFSNFHGINDETSEIEKPYHFVVSIDEMKMDLDDGVTVKFTISDVDSK